MTSRTRSEPRQRTVLLVTRLLPEEAGQIRRIAAEAKLTVSAYLRTRALSGGDGRG